MAEMIASLATLVASLATLLVAVRGLYHLKATHALVNSAMERALKVNADLARKVAAASGLAIDLEAAAEADRLLLEHQQKQAVADS
jgi:hypothetical protein